MVRRLEYHIIPPKQGLRLLGNLTDSLALVSYHTTKTRIKTQNGRFVTIPGLVSYHTTKTRIKTVGCGDVMTIYGVSYHTTKTRIKTPTAYVIS